MENPDLKTKETEAEPMHGDQAEPQSETQPLPETGSGSYVNEKIMHAIDRGKAWAKEGRERYLRSPRLQKITYQGKFLPAFWTVAAIFSLFVNIVLIAVLASIGHNFFQFKALLSDGLINGLSDNLALMDKAHLVTTVPVETTVRLEDNLPVAFDVPINQATQVTLTNATAVDATTYINGALVPLNVTLPAGTPLQLTLDMTIPVSQSVPIDLTVPVSLQVPLDIAVDQTDLHQSIVGLQSAIEPYQAMVSTFNSSEDIPLCTQWWTGWMCRVFFGKP